jgi:hypothetical protein
MARTILKLTLGALATWVMVGASRRKKGRQLGRDVAGKTFSNHLEKAQEAHAGPSQYRASVTPQDDVPHAEMATETRLDRP